MEQHLKAVSRPLCLEQSRRFFCRTRQQCWRKLAKFFQPILKLIRYFNLSNISRYG